MEETIICQSCGEECKRNANNQKYCTNCRSKMQLERNAAYKKRKAEGSVKGLGYETVCPVCGKTFEKASGHQKICSECIASGARPRKKVSELSHEEKHEIYVSNSQLKNKLYDRLSIYVPKGKKEYLHELSASLDMSLNVFVNQAIEYFEKLISEDSNEK